MKQATREKASRAVNDVLDAVHDLLASKYVSGHRAQQVIDAIESTVEDVVNEAVQGEEEGDD